MPLYGVLKSSTNTGLDNELACIFAAPITFMSNQPEFSGDTMTLRRVSNSQNVQRWEIIATVQQTDDPVEFFVGNILAGKSKNVSVRAQLYKGKSEMPDGLAIRSNGNFYASDSTVNLSGASKLIKGEFIRFKNHSKVYLVTNPGVAGVGVEIYPQLTEYVPTLTDVEYGAKTTFLMKYDTDALVGVTYSDGILTEAGQYKLVEAL